MLRRMHAELFALHDHLDAAAAMYDAMYQDIELLNAVGYTESHRSWERIRALVPWRGRRVTDLGCFHGYISFKIEDCGGIVTGLDRSAMALETARMINSLRGGRVEFRQWTGGDPIPECDVVLCLNVLHHFGDAAMQERVVAGMRCDAALFEINAEQLPIVERNFRAVARHRSHRANRVIALASAPR
jgi:2-polyprenyl-3-methyl-5-hydroxy-6-metoxy-1,4-benzoquinol methylase